MSFIYILTDVFNAFNQSACFNVNVGVIFCTEIRTVQHNPPVVDLYAAA